jgi:succinate dehydrogenase/fumarate reductase flavoprotein subunit
MSKALTMIKTSTDHTSILQKEKDELNYGIIVPESAAECSKALRAAKTRVRDIIERSFATRESERDNQIAQLESDIQNTRDSGIKSKRKKITILRNLKKAEAMKRLFQKLQHLRQTHATRGG